MENDRRLQGLFSNVCDDNQVVPLIAARLKSALTRESQLKYGAKFIFDKAVSETRLRTKCVELAKALANVTVQIKGNPPQPKTFRDCIVQLAMDEMNIAITNTEEVNRIPKLNLLMQLHKTGLLSTELINYRIAYFHPLIHVAGVKAFVDKIKLEFAAQNLMT